MVGEMTLEAEGKRKKKGPFAKKSASPKKRKGSAAIVRLKVSAGERLSINFR